MTFDELLVQVRELLQTKGRVSYRALKLQFHLDAEHLEGLKDELIEAERVAADEGGKVLVWVGAAPVQSSEFKVQSSPHSSSQIVDAERRQLTVMFIDLVGSTALSHQLDPEEYHGRVVAYQTACHQVIERYEGHIAQYLGDGVLVYFGYPVAHEEDAIRAVRSGLEIVTAVSHLAYTPRLQVRLGIHTGPVVVGEIGAGEHTERLALGETPNIAARIQGQAAPNEVVISAATYRLVEGLFECEDRGQPDLKGVATPLSLYRVVQESQARSRFEVVARKGLTPLIGREHEYGLLRERWEQAKNGAGQVVLLSGEPGIGKSRLVEALKETVEHEGAACLELRCSPYHQNSALSPVIAHVKQVLRFQSGDSSEEKLQKLVQALEQKNRTQGLSDQFGEHVIASAVKQSLPETEIASSPAALRNDTTGLQEMVSLFASLLSLPTRSSLPALSPQKQKEKTQEALVAWLCAEAKQQAVTYAWEDLQWADPSTLELLTLFLAQIPTTRLLAVLTFRPEFVPPWGAHSYLSQITLSRLGRNHVETMVGKVTGGEALPQEIVQQIVSKTDGVPLFVEELTKSVLESRGATGRSPLQALDIPSTLQDSLMARLDRLGPAKEIAQLGATIGREFNCELLQAVSSLDRETLQHRLKQLVDAELVYQRGLTPQAQYFFKHALVQDAAYQSLLKSKRQQYHQQIAQKLEAQFPETKDTQPELVAHHYTEAGIIAQAIPYWQQAGQRAIERSANIEAISHLTTALELLKTLPDTPERIQHELMLQLTLGVPLMATKGYAAPEVGKAYTRARGLSQQVGETPQLFQVLRGLWTFYVVRGELWTARELGGQFLTLAQRTQDPTLLTVGHYVWGTSLYLLGELIPAREHLEQGSALYDPQKHHSLVLLYGFDPGVTCLCYAAQALWLLGYPDQALERIHGALALARELSHPFTLAFALVMAAVLHQFLREEQTAKDRTEALITLSNEHQFAFILAWGTVMRGWAVAEQGQWAEGIVQMRQGLAAYRVTSAEVWQPYFLALLAEVSERMGQMEEGLNALAEALMLVEKNGERRYEAELYRLKGELTLAQKSRRVGNAHQSESIVKTITVGHAHPAEESEAEACFLKAIEVARKQQAKSLELRATTSLARLWQQQALEHGAESSEHGAKNETAGTQESVEARRPEERPSLPASQHSSFRLKEQEARTKLADAHRMLSEVYHWFTEGFDTKDLQEAKTLLEKLRD